MLDKHMILSLIENFLAEKSIFIFFTFFGNEIKIINEVSTNNLNKYAIKRQRVKQKFH